MKKIAAYSLVLVVLLGIFWAAPAWSVSVAVFPVDDLSKKHNSLDNDITKFISAEVSKRGLTVVPQGDILNFMAELGVRKLGYLPSPVIMQARGAIKADLIILASVCQRQVKPASFGVSISLIRTSDGVTIWSNNSGLSLADEQRFMGINAPQTVADLLPILASNIFANWPVDLDFSIGSKMAGLQIAKVSESSYVQVDSVSFNSKFVRPGQDVKCTVRFKNDNVKNRQVKVFVKVGGQVHLASSDDGVYFNATWAGLDRKQGKNVQVAMNKPSSKVFNEVWNGDLQNASYPVSLILDWPSGKHEESYLGSYVVDSRPPEFTLKTVSKKISGTPVFRGNLPFSVHFQRREPISKWMMAIVDKDSKVVLRDCGSGMVPDQFSWHGQTSGNLRADSGIYYVCLKLWDRAGNSSQAGQKVLLLPTKPEVNVSVHAKGKDIIAIMRSKDKVPVTAWRMELWSQDDKLLNTFSGGSLPVKIRLPIFASLVDKSKIDCVLTVRDSLGSKSIHRINDFLANISTVTYGKAGKKAVSDSVWHADF